MNTREALRIVPGTEQELRVAKMDMSVPQPGPLGPRALVLGTHPPAVCAFLLTAGT